MLFVLLLFVHVVATAAAAVTAALKRDRESVCVSLFGGVGRIQNGCCGRMARLTETMSPEDEIEKGEEGEQVLVLGNEAERLVRATHGAIVQPFFPGHVVNRTAVACNPGVASKRSKSDKKLKVDCLLDANCVVSSFDSASGAKSPS